MSGLMSMPSEMILAIAEKLEPEDLLNFRQSCRAIKEITHDVFAKALFERRCIKLDRRSLTTLRDISRDSKLREFVSEVSISVDRVLDPNKWDYGDLLDYMRSMMPDYKMRPIGPFPDLQFEDQAYLQQSLALENLPSCRMLTLGSYTWHDAPWGVKRVLEQIDPSQCRRRMLGSVSTTVEHIKRCLCTLLEAAMMSNMKLEELKIIFGSRGDGDAVTSEMLSIPDACAHRIPDKLTSLVHLSLTLGPIDSSHWTYRVLRFVNLFPSLSHLTLRFIPYVPLLWGEQSRFQQICNELTIENLQKLEVSGVECTNKDLFVLMFRHRDTLKEIVFDRVGLLDEYMWRQLIRTMRNTLLLERVTLNSCLVMHENLAAFNHAVDGKTFLVEDPSKYADILKLMETQVDEDSVDEDAVDGDSVDDDSVDGDSVDED